MEIIKKSEAFHKIASPQSQIEEYFMNNKKIDICRVHITGREPEKGQELNKECDAICLILSGKGKINGKTFAAGDAFNIPKDTPYHYEGDFEMVMSCTPAWRPDQCQFVD